MLRKAFRFTGVVALGNAMLAACSASSASVDLGDAVADAAEDRDERANDASSSMVAARDGALPTQDASPATQDRSMTTADGPGPDTPADSGADMGGWVDPFGGATGCPDGGFPTARPACELTMPVSGGVSAVASGPCRSSASTGSISYGTNGIYPDVRIEFAEPLVRGLIARNIASTVSLIDDPLGGPSSTWTTPAGACSVNLTSNVCWFYLDATYYLISGTGSCSAPATPDGSNPTVTPVTIGHFSFAQVIFP